METYINYSYTTSEKKFTVWFFRTLVLVAVTVIVLFFTLKINDSVPVKEGEIIAKDPQVDFKAPYDGQIKSIFISEGDEVNQGDTLLILDNIALEEQKANTELEIAYLQEKISAISELSSALEIKIATLSQSTGISSNQYKLNTNRLDNSIKMASEQFEYLEERLKSAKEKYEGDSILFHKDMLSKYDFNDTKDAYLTLKEKVSLLKNEQRQYDGEKLIERNNLERAQNELMLTKFEMEEESRQLQQSLIEFQNQLKQAQQTVIKINKELEMEFIIAPQDGIVNFMFNTKQNSNFLLKGDHLLSLVPDTQGYYAKINLQEKNMPLIKKGLKAKLKVNAYNHFEYGSLEGTVTYVAENKENELYYALVDLESNDDFKLKSGYGIRGEIVLDRLPVYSYFINKLFRKIDGA